MDFSFTDFLNGDFDYDERSRCHTSLVISAETPDGRPGRIGRRDIDRLKEYPDARVATLRGLRQDTFEYFIKTYGAQFRALRFFKCRFVQDWSLLGTLEGIEYIDWFRNQRVTKLWDMTNNKALTGLRLYDFSRLHDLSGIEKAPALREFHFGNAVIGKAVLRDLSPLKNSSVTRFCFTGRDILHKDLSFLSGSRLETFDFPSRLFSTEQVAWIAANHPELSGCSIRPYTEFVCGHGAEGQQLIGHRVVGKNKPSLHLPGHEERLQKYAESFEELCEKYKGLTYKEAFREEKRRKRRKI